VEGCQVQGSPVMGLKRLLADAELDKAILKEATSGNW
jgi:hypothetical protein